MNKNRRKIQQLDASYTNTKEILKSFEEKVIRSQGTSRLSNLDVLNLQKNLSAIRQIHEDEAGFYNALFLFIVKLTNARGAAFFRYNEEGAIEIPYNIMVTSDVAKSKIMIEKVKDIAPKTLQLQKVHAQEVEGWMLLTIPILSENKANSGIVCLLEVNENDELTPYILLLQFIAGYIPLIGHEFENKKLKKQVQQTSSFVDLLKETIDLGSFDKAIDRLLELMKYDLDCQRIAISLVKEQHTKLLAISNINKFDRRARLVQVLQNAMNESLQEKKTIEYPIFTKDRREIQLDLAHQILKDETKSHTIITAIIKNGNRPFAVWSFFWEKDITISRNDVHFIEAVSEYIAPFLILLRKKSFFTRRRTTSSIYKKTFFASLFIGIVYLILMMPYPHYVTASCHLEPLTIRTVSAPFDSIVKKVYYKTGDVVNSGDLLLRLDAREIRLQYFSTQEKLTSARKNTLQLLADKKIAEYQAEMLNVKKIEKEIELFKYRLENVKILSPQTGIIIEGDLEEFLGATVRKGDSLIQIAPLDQLFVKLDVSELDLLFIEKNMKIEINLYAFFDKQWTSKVTYISPMSKTIEQKNIFVCKGLLENKKDELLPGMSGEARIYISEKRVWWVWLYKPISWVKAKLWW